MFRTVLYACLALATTACAAPLAPEVIERVEPGLDFAAVKADPAAHAGKVMILGGSIVALRDADSGCALELLRWELDRLHEPQFLAEAGDRFLVRSRQPLDPDLFTRGRLVTLGAAVDGTGTVMVNDLAETVPAFNLIDILLWDTPFRYGLHANPDPAVPEYIVPHAPGPDQPYDPTPWQYPFPPDWYRHQ